MRMPLREILQRSVANSAEVRVAGYDPAINAAKVSEQEGHFAPHFFTNVNFQRTANQTAGQSIPDPLNPFSSIPLNIDRSDVYTIETGISQLLYSGGQAKLSYLIQNSYFEPARFRRNPFWENTLKLEITQPLLQNFGTQVNAARITIARNDQRISVLDFRKTLEDNLTELEKDYWQLYEADREVGIQEELLLQTIDTYSTVLRRFMEGLEPSLVQVRQSEGAVHARKATLIVAKQRVRDISADIKRRMNDPDFPVAAGVVILPMDAPLVEPVNFETQQQIESALTNRLELGQQQLRIDSSAIAVLVARNGTLPQLNLVGSVGFNGVDSTLFGALEKQDQFNHFSGAIGLQFDYPIGNLEPLSILRRAQLQRQQAIEQYRNLIGQIVLDVVQALNEVDSTWDQIISRQQSRLAFADQLRRLQEQEDVGQAKLTPEFLNVKLQAQSDLAVARQGEAAAIAAYNTAIERLERAKGTLLRYNNIVLEEDKSVPLPRVKR